MTVKKVAMGRSYSTPCLTPTDKKVQNFVCEKYRKTSLGLINQHQLDTLFLVCLLRVNASTCFERYSPIFRRFCTVAIWCNCVRGMCVDRVQVAVNCNPHATNTHPTHAIAPNSNCAEPPEDGRVTLETCRGIDS
jgi:hypothetical protein